MRIENLTDDQINDQIKKTQQKLNQLSAFNTWYLTSPKITRKTLVSKWEEYPLLQGDWRTYAIKHNEMKLLPDLINRIYIEGIENGTAYIKNLTLEQDRRKERLKEKLANEKTHEKLYTRVDQHLKLYPNSYSQRELGCLYALIDSNDIKTIAQLKLYGIE